MATWIWQDGLRDVRPITGYGSVSHLWMLVYLFRCWRARGIEFYHGADRGGDVLVPDALLLKLWCMVESADPRSAGGGKTLRNGDSPFTDSRWWSASIWQAVVVACGPAS